MNSIKVIISLSAFFIYGCGGGSSVERNDVSGAATFDGKPIVFGEVSFIAKHGDETDAPSGRATIENGKFDTANDGQGLVGGPHEIRVTAYPSKPVHSEDETAKVEAVEPIFVGYSYETDIEPPTFDIEIPAEAEGYNYVETGKKQRRNDP